MSDKVKMPDWLAMSSVLENLGWKLSRLGPGLKGTVCSSRGPALTSNTCIQDMVTAAAHGVAACVWQLGASNLSRHMHAHD